MDDLPNHTQESISENRRPLVSLSGGLSVIVPALLPGCLESLDQGTVETPDICHSMIGSDIALNQSMGDLLCFHRGNSFWEPSPPRFGYEQNSKRRAEAAAMSSKKERRSKPHLKQDA